MSTSLERLVKETRFEKEITSPHLLPGFFLVISLAAISASVFTVLMEGEEALTRSWYSSLILLYIGYVVASSYSIYRLLKRLHRHLIDSGITSYLLARQKHDLDAIKKLYMGGLLRREIPSPITGFILGIVSFGLAYPLLLYIVEKNLRRHIYGEEKTFLGKSSVKTIGVEHLLLDIAATLLTFGVYMMYWCWRVVKTYNTHISNMHEKEKPLVELGEVVQYGMKPYPEPLTSSPVLILGLYLIGVGVVGILGTLGLKTHLVLAIATGLLIGYISYTNRFKPVVKHVFKLLGYIYLFLVLISIAGLLASPGYMDFYESTKQQVSRVLSRDFWVLTRNIFTNNLAISLMELIPIIGLIYLGIGLGNAAVFIGIATATSLVRGEPPPLLVYVSPHTFLELLAYAIMASASTRMLRGDGLKNILLITTGIAILFLAAMVESLIILFST